MARQAAPTAMLDPTTEATDTLTHPYARAVDRLAVRSYGLTEQSFKVDKGFLDASSTRSRTRPSTGGFMEHGRDYELPHQTRLRSLQHI